MTRCTYGPLPVFSAGGAVDSVIEGATGGIFSATLNGPALPIYDFNDQPIASISSSPSGQAQWRVDDQLVGWVRFGSVSVRVMSNDAGELLQDTADAVANAAAAQTAAEQALAALQAALSGGVGPGAGGGDGTVTSVNDASPDSNGNVVLSKASIGLDKADNTADKDKPVSTAQGAANTEDRRRANHTGTQAFLTSTTGKRVAFSTDPAAVPAGADADTLVFYLTATVPTAQPPGPAVQLTVNS